MAYHRFVVSYKSMVDHSQLAPNLNEGTELTNLRCETEQVETPVYFCEDTLTQFVRLPRKDENIDKYQ